MSEPFDVIVVGGGHNGLVAAGLLAKRGARHGARAAREGRRRGHDRATVGIGVQDERAVVRRQPHPAGDRARARTRATATRSIRRTATSFRTATVARCNSPTTTPLAVAQIAQFSKADADAYDRWDAWLGSLADVLGPLLATIPPAIGSTRPSDLVDQARLAWTLRRLGVTGVGDVTRLFTMSIADLLDEWFTSPQMQGVLSVSGVIGTWAGPRSPGTAYVMAHHKVGDAGEGHTGSWGFPEGGMGAVSDALRSAALANGATVRTDAPVARIDVHNGARGA